MSITKTREFFSLPNVHYAQIYYYYTDMKNNFNTNHTKRQFYLNFG